MEKFMTAKELAKTAGVSTRTIQRIAKKLYPEKIENYKQAKFNEEESKKIIEETKKKGFIYYDNILKDYDNLSQNYDNLSQFISTIVKQTIIELKKEIIAEIKSEMKSLPKPTEKSNNEININYEWLYPSRLAKYLECKTKWIYDALYQMQMLSCDKYTGQYKITEKGSEYLQWQHKSIMINRILINEIKKNIETWKRNSIKLF